MEEIRDQISEVFFVPVLHINYLKSRHNHIKAKNKAKKYVFKPLEHYQQFGLSKSLEK